MSACANCDTLFEKKSDDKGYFRYSLENSLSTGKIAREALNNLTGGSLTPVSVKRRGQFLCPACWSNLNDTVRYQSSITEFWSKTGHTSYIGKKRKVDSKTPKSTKKPKLTSTPLKVCCDINFH